MRKKLFSFGKKLPKNSLYDYSGSAEREDTCAFLLDFASRSKSFTNAYWQKMRRYYDGEHDIRTSSDVFSDNQGLPWKATQSTDGYIHVETQIEPDIPDFEFSPRDCDDTEKARQREQIVRFICDNSDMSFKNNRNERRLNIQGSAIWKVCWDSSRTSNGIYGDVCIDTPLPEQIFPDPTATDVDSCEYIGYVYKMHFQKARRIFADDFSVLGCDISNYINFHDTDYDRLCGVSDSLDSSGYDGENDTVTITEWWFRQPDDGKAEINRGGKAIEYSWKAGDIALCIFINGKEVRYIPKYWRGTGCKMFPFVIYSKIPNDKSIWGKSELEQIIPLIDAQDRELAFAQLNSAYSSNDIILTEENALSDGENLDNSPGAVWKLRPGMMGKVQRLGNMSGCEASLYNNSRHWRGLIEDTTGNFEVNQGREPTNVTTATGIALLNERAQNRKALKCIDRNAGFSRLYSLIDITALEYYDDGRILKIGAAHDGEVIFRYSDFTKSNGTDEYIPVVDVIIHTGNGIKNSKAFTISALNTLISTPITNDNYKLAISYIDAIGIPQRNDICAFLEQHFGEGENNDGGTL